MNIFTGILLAILFLAIGFVFGITLGIFIGYEIKAHIDKKRQS